MKDFLWVTMLCLLGASLFTAGILLVVTFPEGASFYTVILTVTAASGSCFGGSFLVVVGILLGTGKLK